MPVAVPFLNDRYRQSSLCTDFGTQVRPFCLDRLEHVPNEILEFLIAGIVFFDSLPIAGHDVVFIVQIHEIGIDFPYQISCIYTTFLEVLQNVFLDEFSMCIDDYLVVLFVDVLLFIYSSYPSFDQMFLYAIHDCIKFEGLTKILAFFDDILTFVAEVPKKLERVVVIPIPGGNFIIVDPYTKIVCCSDDTEASG